MSDDTIAAIATAVGDAGIGIVRISGPKALSVADAIFRSPRRSTPSSAPTYTLLYGWVMDQSRVIDEVLLTVMRSPRSYTREDVVEINCHGGIVALRAVLDRVLACGVRLAEPGEFTKRAFLNGRIDLAQAEAVLDIISARTDAAREISLQQLEGRLSREITRLRQVIVETRALCEAQIDFPEEDTGVIDWVAQRKALSGAGQQLTALLASWCTGRVIREGVHVVICGRPNVGKSSLLNALLKQERSIVTPVAGTTRDTIEEVIDIRGIPVRIVDTAGIIEPRDLVEQKAVSRSRREIRRADLVLLVFDGSRRLNKEDMLLIRRLKRKKVIAVINKIDLRQKINRSALARAFPQVIALSAKKATQLHLLEATIAELVYKGEVAGQEPAVVTNRRHVQLLSGAEKCIAEAVASIDNRVSLEFIAQSLREAAGFLDELLGSRCPDDLLEKIFSRFCIGK